MTFARSRIMWLGLLVTGLGLIAGCGSSSSSSSQTSPSAGSSTQNAVSTAAASAPTASSRTVLVATKQSKLGTILAAGPKRMTVYLFEADHGKSTCSGACAKAWPPLLGSAKSAGKAVSADLGTIKRADGTTQVTYKGHPLYFFVKDKDDGDAYGQGVKAFGSDWYVLAPSGNKIDES